VSWRAGYKGTIDHASTSAPPRASRRPKATPQATPRRY